MWLTLLAAATTPAAADCYDLKVRARPVEQVPSELPDSGDDLIMRWPWFLDLRIDRVLDGPPERGTVRVLSLQHTYLVPRRGTWSLRRNALGGYNVVETEKPDRCAASAAPARPFIRPGAGKTLDDLRRAGLARYGPAPR